MLLFVWLVSSVLSLVSGHGNMVFPYTWHDADMHGIQGKKDVGCVHVELPADHVNSTWPNIDGKKICIVFKLIFHGRRKIPFHLPHFSSHGELKIR